MYVAASVAVTPKRSVVISRVSNSAPPSPHLAHSFFHLLDAAYFDECGTSCSFRLETFANFLIGQ